ncbi:MAG: 4-(cytidine 5'-diphospho)-2-C-methyl-D-erythritol kinase [Deltaproteobacteria bacterium]|nr:MAG: 4-(cytidine 5'-diphospho)-2-C-methyl-D-erythritol kinase [Deltaproteobacteria bacterium]
MSKKPDSAAVITARAPAKVNLGLRVLGKRSDGYHDLLSLMVPVNLCDGLQLELCSQGIELHCPNSDLPTGEANLVYRAAQLVLSGCQRSEGVRIELTKKIPVGAGLGGGSSDAATTLVAMNELLGRPLAHQDLYPLGLQLGADVPFFLLGRWARAEGIGDRLTPLENVPTLWTVLVHPHFKVSTRWAYENLTLTSKPNESKFNYLGDTSAEEMAASHQRLLDRQQLTLEDMLPLLVNDFEPLVFGHYPQLHDLRTALLAAGARAALMTGSGPTLVGLFGSEKEARGAHELLCHRDGVTCFVAHTLDTTALL